MSLVSSSLTAFYDTFVKNTSAENLPNLELSVRTAYLDEANLYGTDVDLIIKKYYDNSRTISSFSQQGFGRFDAEKYLNGGSMYEGNTYGNSAYNLDINSALVMNVALANVNVGGENKVGVSTLSDEIVNVRFESDLNGVSLTGAERGVIEFAGDAPDYSRSPSGRSIFSGSVSREVSLDSSSSVDVSVLSTTEAARLKSPSSASTITEVITNSSNAKPTGFIISNTVVGAENATYSSQNWEKAGNQGKNSPAEADLSYALPKKNVKPTKSDLIRTILDENQKQYS